ncbi:MAG: hypothetical protein K5682_12205 [Lachnospiraceae bacterium]|nr:hypothetical protein [Lachnospiraceae bacterium]
MPHSSGGGSHSSGSHGGSYSGGGSSGTRARTEQDIYSTTARRGYSRYAFYTPTGIRYRYVQDKVNQTSSIIIVSVISLFFLIYGIFMIIWAFDKLEPIAIDYTPTIIVDDRIGMLSDGEKDAIIQEFTRFSQETGVTPSLITDYNSAWEGTYASLENYAYDLYVNQFDDEKHWLIVYTQPENPDPDFVDWYWEGMQGDYTDSILSEEVTSGFNSLFHKYLSQNDCTFGDAVTKSFTQTLTDLHMGERHFDMECFLAGIFFIGVILFIDIVCFFSLRSDRKQTQDWINKAHERGIQVSEHEVEDRCNYCGGIYLHGRHESCPHCGAPIELLKDKVQTQTN